ncbi:Wall-associated kinase family protein [Rhynchospora pubera]|uniref:Wall-associated kinase family protein n=1 Tax=Rhynchospora pubera TaxID=906938 RepID=A0AAV8E7Q0_9POAL|nr:Wall-associated kinase family protein [Rhynchospora pubera]
MAPPYLLLLFPLVIVLLFLLPASQASPPVSLQGCKNECGNITIPYPFGFEPGCFREGFRLVCNEYSNPPRLFIFDTDYEITDLDPDGEMQILVTATRACYDSSGRYISGTKTSIDLESTPYRLSISNYFFAIGCPNQGFFVDRAGNYVSGCVSACPPTHYSLDDPDMSCTGVGCCASPIPTSTWLSYYEPYAKWVQLQDFRSLRGTDPTIFSNSTSCTYVFLASKSFNFDNSYLSRINDFKVPVTIQWSIRSEGNCEANRLRTDFACRSANHDCYHSKSLAGYLCSCADGYEGNAYIPGGCQDINECELKDHYPCFGDCENTIGNYTCNCPRGFEGNPRTIDGCRKKDTFTLALKIVTGASVGAFIVAFACFWLYLGMQKRRLIRTKQRFFEQNGGLLLQQQMSSFKTTSFKIYSKEELEIATNKFSEERVLGRGGHGIVYKGTFEDGTIAAIKK